MMSKTMKETMHFLIICLATTFILFSCSGNNKEKTQEITTEEISDPEKKTNKNQTNVLEGTFWSGEKIKEDVDKIRLYVGVDFKDSTECNIQETTELILSDEDSNLSNSEFNGTYEINGLFIYITILSDDKDQEQETKKLILDGDKIKYTSDVHGEFMLEKWE